MVLPLEILNILAPFTFFETVPMASGLEFFTNKGTKNGHHKNVIPFCSL